MAANVFQMDPDSVLTGLADTAAARLSVLGTGFPANPVDNYYSALATAGTAVLSTLSAQLTSLVEQGSLTSAVSATLVVTAENAENVPMLST